VQAEAKYTDGDAKGARELYLAALGKLPALQTAHERLAGMDGGGSTSSRQAVADAVAQADAAYTAGNWKTALDRYEKALGLLRETARDLPRSASRIADAGYRQTTADQAARQDRSARTLVEKADGLVRRGQLDEALVTYASVLDSYPLSSQVKNAVAGISSVVDAKIDLKNRQIGALESSALTEAAAREKAAADALAQGTARSDAEEKMKSLNDSLASAARRGSQAADAARKELISLLKAKVLVKEALSADAVKAEHPGLNESLDRYIELFGEQKKVEGSVGALADMTAVSDFLLGKKTANDLAAMWTRYAEETQRSALQQVLDRLKALIP
jgi:tetratricopeptide (TPR) repeat protein